MTSIHQKNQVSRRDNTEASQSFSLNMQTNVIKTRWLDLRPFRHLQYSTLRIAMSEKFLNLSCIKLKHPEWWW